MNDSNEKQVVQYQVVQPKRFPWGCLLGGCLTVMFVMLIGTGGVVYMGYSFYIGQVNKYTSAEQIEIPKFESSKIETEAIQKRFEDFKTALERDESPEPLVLTSDDINSLISANDELKGKMYVTIADGEVTAQASIPTDFIPGGKGRFFNGRVSLKASLENGVLIVTLDDAEVNGESIPAELLSAIRNENLAKDAYKDRKSAEFLSKFERLSIEDDKIVLKPAPAKAKPTAEPPVTPESPVKPEPPGNL